MKPIWLDISGKIDPQTAAVFGAVGKAAQQLGMPYVVVGASARDLVMHYGYGADIERATQDVDFGMQVADWSAFDSLKALLVERGFALGAAAHRLISPAGTPVDIVPFGGMQDKAAQIHWPPREDVVMSVLGFQEACDHARWVKIQASPAVVVPVATPEGMVLLKLIAWMDRARHIRSKDAKDLLFLLKNYHRIPAVEDLLYAQPELMQVYDWDTSLAGAYQLGREAQAIAASLTCEAIKSLLSSTHQKLSIEQLVDEMCERGDDRYEAHAKLVEALAAGFSATTV